MLPSASGRFVLAIVSLWLLQAASTAMAGADPVVSNGRKTHQQTVTASGQTFTIDVAGNTDPVMRRLEIVGPAVDPKVVCDRWIDPETPATVLQAILKPGMTERDKAMAIFWYCQENFSRNTPWIWDDARFAFALGFGHCGPTGYAQSALCNAAGVQWHQMRLWGHNCIQVWYDNRWHVLDAYMRAIYPGPTGDYAASATELAEKLPFKPKCYSKGLRAYLARVEMKAAGSPDSVGIGSIRFHTELLGHNRALPALRKGTNKITVTATSLPRPLKVIYEYDEVVALAADRYDPVEGTPVKLTAAVTNRGDAPAQNVRVQFYDGDPAALGKPIGQPVVLPSIAAGATATAEFVWPCEATGDRGPYYHGSPEKPFYYCMSNIYALVNPDGKRPTQEQTADMAHFHLFIRQKPKLLITEPFILFIEDEKNPVQVRIRATVRNSCQWEKWIYVRGTTVENVVVRFFDGDPAQGGRQIGTDQVIPSLGPVGFAPADVLWDTSALRPGKHTIWVLVDPDHKIPTRDTQVPNRASKVYEVKADRK